MAMIETMRSNKPYYEPSILYISYTYNYTNCQAASFRPQWYNVVYIFDTIPTYMNDAI